MDKQELYQMRERRIRDAVQLKTPDTVPLMPMMNNYYVQNNGLSMYEAMRNPLVLKEPFLQFMEEAAPDLLNIPAYFPVEPLETSGFTCGRWPGPYFGLSEDTPYQYIDKEYIDDDGYEDFFKDPSRFILQQLMPQKHSAFQALAKIEPYMLTDSAIFGMSVFAEPDVMEALEKLILTGKQTKEYMDLNMQVAALGPENGFPIFGTCAVMAPFDEFADHVRGIMGLCNDCYTQPENVKKAVDLWGDVTIPHRVGLAKAVGAEYVFMPLHCGSDEFMSREVYEEFYWPGLRRAINELVNEGMTPVLFVEGKYDSKLPVLAEVPKGKVIYVFENVNMQQAKKILKDSACIAGGMPTDILMFGDKQRVIDKTKELIDICAPGGGFIMSNTLAMDMVKQDNFEAWIKTTREYGKYGT